MQNDEWQMVHHSSFIVSLSRSSLIHHPFLCLNNARLQTNPVSICTAPDDIDVNLDATDAIDAHVHEIVLQPADECLIAARSCKLLLALPIGFCGGGAEEIINALRF